MTTTDRKKLTAGEFSLFQTEDGKTCLDVRLHQGCVWATPSQLARLFQVSKKNIDTNIKHIFAQGELDPSVVVKEFTTTAPNGTSVTQNNYNLDVLIALGYRIKTHRGMQFRAWVSQYMKEYLTKGYLLDDERLKQTESSDYFNQLQARIRDIRSSDKIFWRKILEIYATSIDYSPSAILSRQFFKAVQNKIHWAVCGYTPSELIHARVDAMQPNVGLNTLTDGKPLRCDLEIAKNYLTPEEMDTYNHLVSEYLDFAEEQVKQRKPMYMQDWISKLVNMLQKRHHKPHALREKVDHAQAILRARAEYDKFRTILLEEYSEVEKHLVAVIRSVKEIENERKQATNQINASL